jgi:hypothetical protein
MMPRPVLMTMLVVALLSSALTVCMIWLLLPRVVLPPLTAQSVVAQEYVLVDAQSHSRGAWFWTDEGRFATFTLSSRDSSGQIEGQIVLVAAGVNGTAITVYAGDRRWVGAPER